MHRGRGGANRDFQRNEAPGLSSHGRDNRQISAFTSTVAGFLEKVGYAEEVSERQDQTDGAVKERVKTEKKEPTLYKVVLLNDDYTTMEFVLRVLEEIFQKSPAEAYRIMMHVHLNGSGIAGVYPWEVAETKVEILAAAAKQAEFPLRAAIEEA
jgi:ATP-dependent Clp protease adaptor protein ClpS